MIKLLSAHFTKGFRTSLSKSECLGQLLKELQLKILLSAAGLALDGTAFAVKVWHERSAHAEPGEKSEVSPISLCTGRAISVVLGSSGLDEYSHQPADPHRLFGEKWLTDLRHGAQHIPTATSLALIAQGTRYSVGAARESRGTACAFRG
jgi:hypothetical protein